MTFVRLMIFLAVLVGALMATPPLYHLSKGNLLAAAEPLPPKAKTDAVMVFTGSTPERLAEGYQAYLKGVAKKIMISGTDFKSEVKDPRNRKLSRKVKKDAVFVDLKARNTIENARNGADWAIKNHIKSILLITSEGHMPRAYFELRRLLPATIAIYTQPVSGGTLKYSRTDTEKGRLMCRMYETVMDSSFCYKTRDIVRKLGM